MVVDDGAEVLVLVAAVRPLKYLAQWHVESGVVLVEQHLVGVPPVDFAQQHLELLLIKHVEQEGEEMTHI